MRLGAYEVLGEIGRGGMGVVYRARGRGPNDFAIKLVQSRDPGALARFEREGRLLASLGEEAGFVPLVEAGMSPAGPFFVMPFLSGGTLRDRIRRGPLSVDETVALGRDLGAALGRTHALGIVHRDLKPENILFSKDGRPLLSDVGLAKHFSSDLGTSQSVSLTRAGESCGTAGYMPPEQMTNAKSVGPAADVYALGLILYECLAGRPAFQGETIVDVCKKVAAGDLEPIARTRPDVPRGLADIIERSLARDPARRFPDGAALEAALRRPLAGKRAWPLAVAVLATIGVAGAAVVAVGRRAGGSSPGQPTAAAPTAAATPAIPPQADLPTYCSAFRQTKTARLAVALDRDREWTEADDVLAVAFTPDGGVLAATAREVALRDGSGKELWRAARPSKPEGDHGTRWLDGEPRGRFRHYRARRDPVVAMAVAKDGRSAVIASGGVVESWDLGARAVKVALHAEGAVVSLSPDGSHVAFTAPTGEVSIHDVATGEIVRLPPGQAGDASHAVTSDGAVLTAADRIYLFTRAGRETLGDHRSATATAVSLDGRWGATAGDGRVCIWDLEKKRLERERPSIGRENVDRLVFTPDGRSILSASSPREEWGGAGFHDEGTYSLCLIDPSSGRTAARQFRDGIEAIAVAVDGGTIATCAGRSLRLWSAADLSPRSGTEAVTAVALAHDGLLVLRREGNVTFHDATTGKILRSFDAVGATEIGFASERRAWTLSSGELYGGKLASWDLERGMVVETAERQFYRSVTPDGRFALTSGGPGVAIVEVQGAKRLWEEPGGAGAEWRSSASLSPDGAKVLLAGWHGNATVVDRVSRRTTPLEGQVAAGVMGPNGRVATLGDDGTCLHVIERGGNSRRVRLAGESGAMVHYGATASFIATFSPDGKRLFTVSGSRVEIWDEEGRPVDRIDLTPALDVVTCLGVAPDGQSFALGTARGSALVFRWNESEPRPR
jgi:WD40 repeat protein